MKYYAFFVLLVAVEATGQTFTEGQNLSEKNFKDFTGKTMVVCHGYPFSLSLPDRGQTLDYRWSHSNLISLVSQNRNQATFLPQFHGGTTTILGSVAALSASNPDSYYIYRFWWKIESVWCDTRTDVYSPTSIINYGDIVTYAVPNYGTSVDGIGYLWENPFQIITQGHNSVTFRANRVGLYSVGAKMTANAGQWWFGSYFKNFDVRSSGGGGGGGGCESYVYPNPSDGEFTLIIKNQNGEEVALGDQKVLVTDVSTNQNVFEGTAANAKNSLRDFASKKGVYVISTIIPECPSMKTRLIVDDKN